MDNDNENDFGTRTNRCYSANDDPVKFWDKVSGSCKTEMLFVVEIDKTDEQYLSQQAKSGKFGTADNLPEVEMNIESDTNNNESLLG
jgi:hypothetical protein